MTTCPQCGRELQIADWPFCPHKRTGGYANFRDEIPGGLVCENYGPHPVTFYSHSERRRYMKQQGLVERETFAPFPGTDKDPQGIPNPKGYVDPQTLENARVLVSRNGRGDSDLDESGKMVGATYSGFVSKRDAVAIADGDATRQSRLHRRIDGSH